MNERLSAGPGIGAMAFVLAAIAMVYVFVISKLQTYLGIPQALVRFCGWIGILWLTLAVVLCFVGVIISLFRMSGTKIDGARVANLIPAVHVSRKSFLLTLVACAGICAVAYAATSLVVFGVLVAATVTMTTIFVQLTLLNWLKQKLKVSNC